MFGSVAGQALGWDRGAQAGATGRASRWDAGAGAGARRSCLVDEQARATASRQHFHIRTSLPECAAVGRSCCASRMLRRCG